jgi:hypothetical protein
LFTLLLSFPPRSDWRIGPNILHLTIVVIGLQKSHTETEVVACLELNDVYWAHNVVVQCGLLVFGFFGIEIPGIYYQDQKYNNKNTRTITEIMIELRRINKKCAISNRQIPSIKLNHKETHRKN